MKLLLAFVVVYGVWGTGAAHAYIDPGSGSAIMSVIIGFFVAAGLVVKTYWYKLKSLFTGKKNTKSTDTERQDGN